METADLSQAAGVSVSFTDQPYAEQDTIKLNDVLNMNIERVPLPSFLKVS